MKAKLIVLASALTGSASALTVVNTTPGNNQANLVSQAGQTFTTPVLGGENKLDKITVLTGSTISGTDPTGPFTLKVFTDTDGNFATWDPGVEVAASVNSATLTPAGRVAVVFTFSGQALADNTVYALSFNNGTVNHAGFRASLTNAAGVAISNGALFSAGAQPFSGAFDLSFIVATNTGAAPKSVIWTAATDGTWNTATSNWKLADNSPASFNNGDSVTFDNSSADGTVTVSAGIEPASILVNNDDSLRSYVFGGSPIAGPATLTKDGPGTLTLTTNQAYLGGTVISGGRLVAGDGATSGQIGAGTVSVAAGATLQLSRSDLLDYKVVDRLRILSGDGDVIINGGGLVFTYPGGGTGFNSAGSWAGFSGDITVTNGSEWQSIRNGASGRGTGTIILGDATTSGSISGIEGNWTWTNPIQAIGPDNKIINRSGAAAFSRSLKIQGPISGTGNLTIRDATGAMSSPNDGFVITQNVSLGGTLTIDSATPVRIGGVPGEVDVTGTGLNAADSGSLGTTTVVNNGTLTFSRTDNHTVASAISGTGSLRIGMPSTANRGDTSTQVVVFPDGTKTHTGTTFVESGTLLVNGSLPNSFVDVNPQGTLGGTGTIGQSTIVYGRLAPGASVGTLAFNDELIMTAGSTYQFEISDFSGSAGSGHDTLTAADLVLEGTQGSPVTIVITPSAVANFSESPATFTLASSPQAMTLMDPAGFIVDDTAFAVATGSIGTWSVQPSGDLLTLQLVYTPGDPDSFAGWIKGHFPGETDPAIVGFDADPDGDGIGNGLENFLGSDPDGFNAGLVPTGAAPGSLTVTHTRNNDPADDVNGSYQWSSDLLTWQASGVTDGNGVKVTLATQVILDQVAPLNDTVQATATVIEGSTARVFLRAIATQGP